jgi:phage tail sheath protein FI
MATYSRPGVYIEESLAPLSDITADPTVSVAAFVGVTTNGGPVGAQKINSWSQFQSLYGGVGSANDDLAYAVYTYFANGAPGCYVVRAINSDATKATLTLNDTQGTPASSLKIDAQAGGTWASLSTSVNRVFVTVTPTSTGRFDFVVEVGSGAFLIVREQFLDVTMDPNDPRYVVDIVNSPVIGSKYVTLTSMVSGTWGATKNPAAATKTPLTGGTDGTGSPDVAATAVAVLSTVDENLVINMPGVTTSAQLSTLINWAAGTGRHFVVADVPKPASGELEGASVTAMTTLASALPTSSYAALYGPWVYVTDPGSRTGNYRLTAPGGAVVAQYLRTDAARGSFKAPAGVNTTLQTVVQPYLPYTDANQDTLSQAQVNLIKRVPGGGVCIMGARTLATGYPDRYIPVRRTLTSLKGALTSLSRFAIFEPNDGDLRATLIDVFDSYLLTQMEVGALAGANAQEAYFITCDESNNPPANVAAGLVTIDVGVALQTPAEFIVIRIGQQRSGAATAADTLEQ